MLLTNRLQLIRSSVSRVLAERAGTDANGERGSSTPREVGRKHLPPRLGLPSDENGTDMSTGPILDHFWLFAGGVLLAPILGSAVVAAVVRWWAARRGYAIEESRWLLAGVVLVLFVLMPVGGGLILGPIHGIPPGLGFGGTLLFLFGVYGGPVLLGAFLFGRFLAGRLSLRDGHDGDSARYDGDSSGHDDDSSGHDGDSVWVVVESSLWFVCVHLALFPAVFALAIAAS